ncbi:MAG: DUF2062 domain-containing protein [Planctomycetaceae bacterium]|nr:DUF2062 domain-containing protein [Planctomycetaceae bacterium]
MSSFPTLENDQKTSMPSGKRIGWTWCVSPRLWVRKIIGLDDTPRAIALGAAIGTFIAFTPTVGAQMLIVLAVGWLCKPVFRFNKLASLVAVYISNPVTTLPIYWFNYWVGSFIVPGNLTRERLATFLDYQGFSQWGQSLWAMLVEIGWPLLLGSLIVGLLCALPTYPLVKFLVESLQARKRAHQIKQGV